MTYDELARASSFRLAFARAQASRVTPVRGGFAVLDADYHHSHEHNQVHLDGTIEPAEAPDIVERALASVSHRRVTIYDDALGTACAPAFAAAGYGHDVEIVMAYRGPAVVPMPTDAAVPVDLATLGDALTRQQRSWLPDIDDEAIRQLVARRTARLRGAEQVVFLALRDSDGEPMAWCDLYLDTTTRVAQVEELTTGTAYLRRGHAGAVLRTALRRARAAGCELCFLVAEADDWPRAWYARAGFTEIGRTHGYMRF